VHWHLDNHPCCEPRTALVCSMISMAFHGIFRRQKSHWRMPVLGSESWVMIGPKKSIVSRDLTFRWAGMIFLILSAVLNIAEVWNLVEQVLNFWRLHVLLIICSFSNWPKAVFFSPRFCVKSKLISSRVGCKKQPRHFTFILVCLEIVCRIW